jgi:hypothetical protein
MKGFSTSLQRREQESCKEADESQHRQSVPQISAELGITVDTSSIYRKVGRMKGKVVPELDSILRLGKPPTFSQ